MIYKIKCDKKHNYAIIKSEKGIVIAALILATHLSRGAKKTAYLTPPYSM